LLPKPAKTVKERLETRKPAKEKQTQEKT